MKDTSPVRGVCVLWGYAWGHACVCACLCECVHECVFVCACVYMNVCMSVLCVCAWVCHVYMSACMWVCLSACMCVHVWVCVCKCKHECVCESVCVCTYMSVSEEKEPTRGNRTIEDRCGVDNLWRVSGELGWEMNYREVLEVRICAEWEKPQKTLSVLSSLWTEVGCLGDEERRTCKESRFGCIWLVL